MDEVIKKLEEKGIIKWLQQATNVFTAGQDVSQENLDECIEGVLEMEFKEDEELGKLFYKAAMKQLVDKIGLKPNPDHELTMDELLAKMLLTLGL